ncbi:Elongator subunit elp6 [Chamberlinius hualienensis]
MAQDLQMALDWNLVCSKSSFTVVSESGYCDISFVINHLLIKHVASGHPICLVLFNHTFQHFHQIASKYGVNLLMSQQHGQLHVLESLKDMYEFLTEQKKRDMIYENGSLRNVFSKIRAITQGLGGSHFLLVVDDISVLINLGVSVVCITEFILNCRIITSSSASCLVVAVNSDEDDREKAELLRSLKNWCDSSLEVVDLPSGHSKDVNGKAGIIFPSKHRKRHMILADRVSYTSNMEVYYHYVLNEHSIQGSNAYDRYALLVLYGWV